MLTSLGLYTMAKRRMINHPWLSWVPVANMWILGSLSDQYRYVAKGQVKNKRKILLGLSIARAAAFVLFVFLIILMVAGVVSDAVFDMASVEDIFMTAFGGIMGVLGLVVLMLPLTIVTLVFRYMALYDLYLSCDPENAVLFLVLSIVVNITEPFFIFCSRNREKGMPPRRPRPEQIPPYEARMAQTPVSAGTAGEGREVPEPAEMPQEESENGASGENRSED